MKNFFSKTHLLVAGSLLITFLAIGYLEYTYHFLRNKNNELETNLENSQKELDALKVENSTLKATLSDEQNKNNSFQEQIGKISSTVGTLEKIKNTDPQLLQKYSKVYFLNENYIPSKLTLIDPKYTDKKELYIHAGVWPHLKQMFMDAADDGIDLKIVSAYRSFSEQAAVKTGYKFLYGSGANKFSADQGYSEHQLGTTVDVDTASSTATLKTTFEKTKAYEWLTKNGYKYGFILSYPKQNTYYQFEPWHWRFVGIELAKKLHDDGKYFYEMDQRDINTYLANFFD